MNDPVLNPDQATRLAKEAAQEEARAAAALTEAKQRRAMAEAQQKEAEQRAALLKAKQEELRIVFLKQADAAMQSKLTTPAMCIEVGSVILKAQQAFSGAFQDPELTKEERLTGQLFAQGTINAHPSARVLAWLLPLFPGRR